VDNQEIDSLPRFSTALFLHKRDRPIEVEVLRGREVMKRSIIPAEASRRVDGMAEGIDSMAEEVDSMADLVDPQNNLVSPLGVFVLELTDKPAEGLPDLRSTKGLVVAAKVDYAPQLDAELEIGDVIRSMNGVPLNHAADLRAELARHHPGDAIVLEIERKRVFQFTAFEME
jgi:predicted metalloprotease with PDZ domain